MTQIGTRSCRHKRVPIKTYYEKFGRVLQTINKEKQYKRSEEREEYKIASISHGT